MRKRPPKARQESRCWTKDFEGTIFSGGNGLTKRTRRSYDRIPSIEYIVTISELGQSTTELKTANRLKLVDIIRKDCVYSE